MTRIRSSDGSNVQDRRGQGGGGFSFPGLGRSGGTGLPIPGGLGGGGLIGLLILAAVLILPRVFGGGGGPSFITPDDAQQQVGEQSGTTTCDDDMEQILCG